MFEKLRKTRIAKGITCQQMADKLGMTKATYSKKERGKITMTLSDAERIASILNASVDNIFFAGSVSFKET